MSANPRFAHLLELADKGPALRAALAEEVAALLLEWPADCPAEMRPVFENLLAKAAHDVDADTRARLRANCGGRSTSAARSGTICWTRGIHFTRRRLTAATSPILWPRRWGWKRPAPSKSCMRTVAKPWPSPARAPASAGLPIPPWRCWRCRRAASRPQGRRSMTASPPWKPPAPCAAGAAARSTRARSRPSHRGLRITVTRPTLVSPAYRFPALSKTK